MEYSEGQTLADFGADKTRFTRAEFNRCALELIKGLATLHAAK